MIGMGGVFIHSEMTGACFEIYPDLFSRAVMVIGIESRSAAVKAQWSTRCTGGDR